MNRLTLFISLLFVIGILLVITSFMTYSKLTELCKSEKLRTYLRLCVIIGSVLLTISIMYMICTQKKGCKCDFDIDAGWKIYLTLFILEVLGVFLVFLASGINSEIKTGGCNVDLGYLPSVLMGIAITQIVIPVIYTGIVIYTGKSGSTHPDEEEEEESTISRMESSRAEQSAVDKQRRDRLTAHVAELSVKLSRVNDKAEKYETRGKDVPPKVRAEQIKLENQLTKFKKRLSSVGSTSSSSSSSLSSSSSGGFDTRFGGGFGSGGFSLSSSDED